jgi:uncharacterized MAPEG superfamily protein
MTVALWCVLIAGLLPYLTFGGAATKLDPELPRMSAKELEGVPARIHGAHLNHFEAFPFFAAAVIISHVLQGSSQVVNWLAVAFIVVRLVYTFFYMTGRQPLRSATFGIGLLIVVAIFLTNVFR